MNSNLKKALGIGLSVFALFISSASLTGCEAEGEGEGEGVEELEPED